MSPQESTSGMSALARIVWMMLGPMALLLFTVGIVRTGNGWATGYDIAFFIALGLMLAGRWLEFRAGNPKTSTGEPANPSDLPRYLVTTGAVGIVLWIVANVLGNYVLTP